MSLELRVSRATRASLVTPVSLGRHRVRRPARLKLPELLVNPSQPGTTGATATPGKQGTVAKAGSRSLAHTGSDAAAPFALGGMLVLAGGALVATRRKNS